MQNNTKTKSFYPVHYYLSLIIIFLLLGLLITLAVYFPHSLTERANPFEMPTGTLKPPWYFLPIYLLLELLPEGLAETLGFIALIIFIFWPFLDRGPARHYSRRKISAAIGVAAFFTYIGFLIWGMMH